MSLGQEIRIARGSTLRLHPPSSSVAATLTAIMARATRQSVETARAPKALLSYQARLTRLLIYPQRTLSPIANHKPKRRWIVKRLLALFVCLVLFTGAALPVQARRHHRRSYASCRCRCHPRRSRAHYRRYAYQRRTYYAYRQRRSFWQRHRDALTLAIGTGGGAAIGGLLGGRRGAGYGALAGLGGSALYTYKLRDRRRRY
jgi:hypothetical protein